MLKPTNRLMIGVVLAFGVASAYALDEIEFQDGAKTSNCTDYNRIRATQGIASDTQNLGISSEYLDCSLAWGGVNIASSDNVEPIAKALRVRQFATSLNQRIESDSDTFVKLGATYNAAEHALKFLESDQYVNVTFKQKKGSSYLVWFEEVIQIGTYRAFYPAIVVVDGSNIDVKPYYASGF